MKNINRVNALLNQRLFAHATAQMPRRSENSATWLQNHVSSVTRGGYHTTSTTKTPLGLGLGLPHRGFAAAAEFGVGPYLNWNPNWMSVAVGSASMILVLVGVLGDRFILVGRTQSDVAHLGSKIDALATDIKAQAAETKSQFAAQAAETKSQIDALAAETKSQFAAQAAETKSQIEASAAHAEQLNAIRFASLKDEIKGVESRLTDKINEKFDSLKMLIFQQDLIKKQGDNSKV